MPCRAPHSTLPADAFEYSALDLSSDVPGAEQEYSGRSSCLKVVSEKRTSPARRPWLLAQAGAILAVAATASAQSSLTLPNNSAGTEMDTPPILPSTPGTNAPLTPPRDGVTREQAEQLAGPKEAEEADRNRDGRLDSKELRRLDQAPAPLK